MDGFLKAFDQAVASRLFMTPKQYSFISKVGANQLVLDLGRYSNVPEALVTDADRPVTEC
jgi:hypothetical protein